jgi:hypothetical protein
MSGLKIVTTGEYPRLWQRGLIQTQVRKRANHQCEECGMEFQEGTNLALNHFRKNGQPFVGTVHHIDGNKANCSMRNLVYLCQACHYRLHLLGWTPGHALPRFWYGQPPRWVVERGFEYKHHPQMRLNEVMTR